MHKFSHFVLRSDGYDCCHIYWLIKNRIINSILKTYEDICQNIGGIAVFVLREKRLTIYYHRKISDLKKMNWNECKTQIIILFICATIIMTLGLYYEK